MLMIVHSSAAHNQAQNSSDDVPFSSPDSHHSSDAADWSLLGSTAGSATTFVKSRNEKFS